MKINTKIISELNPCSDRFDNWKTHYEDFDGSVNQFLDLDKITHSDKLWVVFRLLDKKQVVECACRFAEEVLHIYESKYPNDNRPRKAIEAARLGDKKSGAAAAAAYAAAYTADAAYAAAAYAAYAAAAYAAYAAADAAAAAKLGQEAVQIQIIKDVIAGD